MSLSVPREMKNKTNALPGSDESAIKEETRVQMDETPNSNSSKPDDKHSEELNFEGKIEYQHKPMRWKGRIKKTKKKISPNF